MSSPEPVKTTTYTAMPWSGLSCDEKGRFLAAVAVADDHLHNNDSIEAPAEYPMDRIRFRTAAVGERVTKLAANVEDGTEAGHTTSDGARSAVITYILEG